MEFHIEVTPVNRKMSTMMDISKSGSRNRAENHVAMGLSRINMCAPMYYMEYSKLMKYYFSDFALLTKLQSGDQLLELLIVIFISI